MHKMVNQDFNGNHPVNSSFRFNAPAIRLPNQRRARVDHAKTAPLGILPGG
jgi:hypothetical protein